MIIELLYSDKNIIKINNIDQIPKDLSGICSVQIINYAKQDVAKIEKLFDIDTTILNILDVTAEWENESPSNSINTQYFMLNKMY